MAGWPSPHDCEAITSLPQSYVGCAWTLISAFGVYNDRRAALQRVDPSHRLVAWRGRLLLARPTSAPGPGQGTSDHWWRRPVTMGSFSGAGNGVDFGHQRHHR